MTGDELQLDAKVLVIGGGPAGATIGAYLARGGHDTVLIERDIHPREHVGESFVPSTNKMLEEIGFFPKMDELGFIRKPGATWTSYRGRPGAEAKITFADVPQPEIKQDFSYHVDRGKFDAYLLRHAADQGVKVIQGVNVLRVLFDEDGRACGARVRMLGREFDLRAKYVVDASGRRGLLGRQLGLMEKDQIFNQFAIYSWFKGVVPPVGESWDYIHIHFLPVQRGWVWQIPITEEIASVGVVVEKEVFSKSGKDHEGFFNELIGRSVNTSQLMQNAERVRPLFVEGDYSYKMDRFAGPGWLLIGDACRFVDPIFSSGVSVAMNSARFAFRAIDSVEKGEKTEEEAFASYNDTVGEGVAIWYEWIKIYYKLQHLFTRLGKDKNNLKQMQQLLQGEVFDRSAVDILDRLKEAVKTIEETEGHLLKPMVDAAIPID